MTEAERRHLRRIVSNRRSAQRVRERKSAVMRDMEVKVDPIAPEWQRSCLSSDAFVAHSYEI